MRRILCLSWLFCACAASPPSPELRTADGELGARLVAVPPDPAAHADSCKPYHEVFAPDGRLLTKGLGGTYPHHRGLFVGWNQVQVGGERFDFWHCKNGETQRLQKLLTAEEHRRGGAGEHWLELVVELRAGAAAVLLDGDPQHAGCQFRALQQFADRADPAIRYLRPSTAAGGKEDVWTGCGWIAAVLPFEDQPVTVLRCEHAGNPPATWSTRPYGRFGAMCKATIAPHQALTLRYSYVVALGERDAAWCAGTWAKVTAR
ncbi:MAG: PmoA family protein [Planctomycetes bacterium]|nr:PmoA family protein [Planctomycetota bacterium]